MLSNSRRVLFFGLSVLLLAGLGFFLYTNILRPRLVIPSKITASTPQTSFEFKSSIAGLSLVNNSVKIEAVEDYLGALNLYPLKDKPFIGALGSRLVSRVISPDKIVIEYRDLSTLAADKTKSSQEQLVELQAVENVSSFVMGTLSNSEKTLTIPIYINTQEGKNYLYGLDSFLTEAFVRAMYFNLRITPPVEGTNPFEEIGKKIPDFSVPVFKSDYKESVNLLQGIKIVKEVYAQCSGSVTCGTRQWVQGTCNNPGRTRCDSSAQCGIGFTCSGARFDCVSPQPGSCDYIGGASGSNPQCNAICFSCQISGSCAVTGPPPPPPLPPPPAGPPPPSGGAGVCTGSGGCMGGANCGSNGRDPASCSGGPCCPGQNCCGDIAGGGGGGFNGCSVQSTNPSTRFTLSVGQTRAISQSDFQWSGAPEHMSFIRFTTGNTAIATSAPTRRNVCCNWYWGSRVTNGTITGVAPGTTFVQFQCISSNGESDFVRVTVDVVDNLPSATINLTPNPLVLSVGQTGVITADITTQNGGVIQDVRFTSSNPSVATSTSPDVSSPYTSDIVAISTGTTTITGTATLTTGETFTDTAVVNVANLTAWWRVINGDVVTNGNVESFSPSDFMLDTPSGNPISSGVLVFGGSADFDPGPGSGQAAVTPNWNSNTTYNAAPYDWSLIQNLLPSTTVKNIIGPGSYSGNLNGGTLSPDGFNYCVSNGPLTLNSAQNINTKTILIVDGDLTINERVNIANPSNDFFMAIVNGDIIVSPTLSGPPTPQLQGLFLSQGSFNTGAGVNPLLIEGSVAGLGGVNLGRDLGANNANTPGEEFLYDPRLFLNYPESLLKDSIIWREIAP